LGENVLEGCDPDDSVLGEVNHHRDVLNVGGAERKVEQGRNGAGRKDAARPNSVPLSFVYLTAAVNLGPDNGGVRGVHVGIHDTTTEKNFERVLTLVVNHVVGVVEGP
jgi:hypothetical protein